MFSNPRILVAGCGAIGSVFGCLLREAGHDVALLGRENHLKAIHTCGLRLNGIWGDHYADGFTLATKISDLSGIYDLVLISVKSYDTESIARDVAAFINDDGLVASLQNGLGNIETLAKIFGAERSLGANVLVGATIPEPGRATVTVQAAPVIIGPLEVSDCVMMERIHYWIRAFKQAHIPCAATVQILSYLWAKIFYNAPLNALGALLQVPYGVLGDQPELRRIMDRVVDEAFLVAASKGVEILWKTVDEYRELFYSHLIPSTYNHQSSMLQDLQRGRLTEIDAINGQIWRYGRELGILTPFNETLTRLIWERERKFKQAN
ncbi:MAG: ketopantoate reductase family protein [Candidatus Binatia bacterium]|jgi:2-dehydropantoate 2-reductase